MSESRKNSCLTMMSRNCVCFLPNIRILSLKWKIKSRHFPKKKRIYRLRLTIFIQTGNISENCQLMRKQNCQYLKLLSIKLNTQTEKRRQRHLKRLYFQSDRLTDLLKSANFKAFRCRLQ